MEIDHPPTAQFDGFYRRTTDEMTPAATIDLADARRAAGPGEGLALYISNAGTELLPFVIPIPQSDRSVLVPAESPVLVLRTVGARVIGASDPLTLKPRERRAVTFPPDRDDAGDVLAWVAFPEEERVPAGHWPRMPPPQVALRSGAQTIEPVIASRGSFGNDGALFLFRGVPPGRWSVTLSGAVWKRAGIAGDTSALRPEGRAGAKRARRNSGRSRQ